jgi:phosphoglucosamine mutase
MGLFGTSGIRRVVAGDLIQLALKVGLVVGKRYPSVVVASDTRTSSSALKHALISGVLSGGAGCFDAGLAPTPTLAFAARNFAAGVMITASHNPPEYNGIKLFNPDGSAFDADQRREMVESVQEAFTVVPWDKFEGSEVVGDVIKQHTERILKDFFDGRKNERKLKVVVDCGCGAACQITPGVLTRLDCEVVVLNGYPSGFFPREVEPTEANLEDLARATRKLGADLGIAHDGDADRMMIVDERGEFVAGDKLFVLFARERGSRTVVTTLDASMMIEELGFRVTRTPVGDTYVSAELKKGGDFGGEPSGSWLFPEVSLCPDGVYAAAQVVAIAGRERISRLVNDLPTYPMLRGSVSGDRVVMSRLEQKLLETDPLSVDNTDGIKLNFADGWLFVRASGTEPKIRVTAEAKTEARVHELYDGTLEIVRDMILTSGGSGGEVS